jgi:hypothetical protein
MRTWPLIHASSRLLGTPSAIATSSTPKSFVASRSSRCVVVSDITVAMYQRIRARPYATVHKYSYRPIPWAARLLNATVLSMLEVRSDHPGTLIDHPEQMALAGATRGYPTLTRVHAHEKVVYEALHSFVACGPAYFVRRWRRRRQYGRTHFRRQRQCGRHSSPRWRHSSPRWRHSSPRWRHSSPRWRHSSPRWRHSPRHDTPGRRRACRGIQCGGYLEQRMDERG